jgi:hypothetical protein
MWGPERARTSLRRVAVQVQIAGGTCCGRSSALASDPVLVPPDPRTAGATAKGRTCEGFRARSPNCKKLGAYDFEMAEGAATTQAIAAAILIATLPLLSPARRSPIEPRRIHAALSRSQADHRVSCRPRSPCNLRKRRQLAGR